MDLRAVDFLSYVDTNWSHTLDQLAEMAKHLHREGHVLDYYSTSDKTIIKNGQLVSVRAMVSDIRHNEMYIKQYLNKDGRTGTGLLRDFINDAHPDFMESPAMNKQLGDRQILLGMHIPGVSDHVQEHWNNENKKILNNINVQSDVTMESSSSRRKKRGRVNESESVGQEDMNDNETTNSSSSSFSSFSSSTSHQTGDKKMTLIATTTTTTNDNTENINDNNNNNKDEHSLWNLKEQQPCIIKLYNDDNSDIRVCDIIEFIGVYALDAEVAELDQVDIMGDEVIPASVAPRLHCLYYQKIDPSLLYSTAPLLSPRNNDITTNVLQVKNSLVKYIANNIVNDPEDMSSAEIILLHMISRVHKRVHDTPVGTFTLNTLVPDSSERIIAFYQTLLPKVTIHQVSPSSLNQRPWAPRMDYEKNRMVYGPLQTAHGTVLVFDETKMEAGNISEVGTTNLTRVQKIIRHQQLEYDFKFSNNINFPLDSPVLIVSPEIGKSILPYSIRLHLKEATREVEQVSVETLNIWREYISYARMWPFELTEENTQQLATSFVDDKNFWCPSEFEAKEGFFHLTLSLTRLSCSSKYQNSLDYNEFIKIRQLLHTLKVGQE